MDFDELFGNAKQAVQKSLDDALRVGRPAVEASLQQWGIDTLKSMQVDSQKNLNAELKKQMDEPSRPGSFGAALSSTVQGTILETYGLQIVIGVALLIILGMALKGK